MITLTGDYGRVNNTDPQGHVDIVPAVSQANASIIMVQDPVTAALSEGKFTVDIVASDDPLWALGPIPYIFTEHVEGRTAQWMAYVNGPGPVDVSELIPLGEPPDFYQPVPGPQGPQGPQGDTGPQGEPGTSGFSDHGLLTGLADNDHPQYQLTSAKDAVGGYVGKAAGTGESTVLNTLSSTAKNVIAGTTGANIANLKFVNDSVSYHEGLADPHPGLVGKALFDAHTILAATTNDTPAPLTVPASTLVGRGAAGGIAALSVAEVRTLVGTTRVTRPLIDDLLIETYDSTLGWVVTKYDSGWREIATWGTDSVVVVAPGFTFTGAGAWGANAGFIRCRKVNGKVQIYMRNAQCTSATVTIAGFGIGWVPVSNQFPPGAHVSGTSTAAFGGYPTTTSFVTIAPAANTILSGISIEYLADGIPNSLPGTLFSAAPLT